MEQSNTQALFFQHIKTLLPAHISLVDAIADLLDISVDSAYRRIRSEKSVSLEELQKLAVHFKVSMDQFFHIQSDSYIFSGKLADGSNHDFAGWMNGVLQQLQFMNSFPNRHMYYLAKDLPVMAQFLVPELLAFKSFFWQKSILHSPEFRGVKFSFKEANQEYLDTGRRIVDAYNQLPSTEIWNIESINSTIRQIEFYNDAGVFADNYIRPRLYEAVNTIIDHLERQAEIGLKFKLNGEPLPTAAAYNLFNNELVLGDNTIVADLEGQKVTILNHSVINFIRTGDARFNAYMFRNLQNLIGKSTQLSKVGEKERVRFFNGIRERISNAQHN
jgi:hypothetical protein